MKVEDDSAAASPNMVQHRVKTSSGIAPSLGAGTSEKDPQNYSHWQVPL
jgi:hypothetical protein